VSRPLLALALQQVAMLMRVKAPLHQRDVDDRTAVELRERMAMARQTQRRRHRQVRAVCMRTAHQLPLPLHRMEPARSAGSRERTGSHAVADRVAVQQ